MRARCRWIRGRSRSSSSRGRAAVHVDEDWREGKEIMQEAGQRLEDVRQLHVSAARFVGPYSWSHKGLSAIREAHLVASGMATKTWLRLGCATGQLDPIMDRVLIELVGSNMMAGSSWRRVMSLCPKSCGGPERVTSHVKMQRGVPG